MRMNRLFALLTVFLLSLPLTATAMDGATMKEHLNKVFGDNSTWAVATLSSLEKNMSYEKARAVFPQLPEADAAAKKIFIGKVKVKDTPTVDYYELKFREGKLYGAIVNFQRNLDKEVFKQVSLEVFENKFGKVKPEKRDKNTINKFNSEGPGYST